MGTSASVFKKLNLKVAQQKEKVKYRKEISTLSSLISLTFQLICDSLRISGNLTTNTQIDRKGLTMEKTLNENRDTVVIQVIVSPKKNASQQMHCQKTNSSVPLPGTSEYDTKCLLNCGVSNPSRCIIINPNGRDLDQSEFGELDLYFKPLKP